MKKIKLIIALIIGFILFLLTMVIAYPLAIYCDYTDSQEPMWICDKLIDAFITVIDWGEA